MAAHHLVILITQWTGMFKIKPYTFLAFMVFPTVALNLNPVLDSSIVFIWGKMFLGGCDVIHNSQCTEPQGYALGSFLSQIPKVFIIITPIVSSCCQIPNNVTIFHKSTGLLEDISGCRHPQKFGKL